MRVSKNIAATLADRAVSLGDTIGLIEAATGKTLTFSQLNNRADGLAHRLLERGVQPGKRIMLMVKPSADFICLTFALFKIGCPVILIDPGMGYKNLLRCIQGVKPDVLLGIPKAILFSRFFPRVFGSVGLRLCCGFSYGLFGRDVCAETEPGQDAFPACETREDDLAAIIFTTGSTGPPKGVRYNHGVFYAQLQLIRDYYHIGPGEIDQPAFPLFALFSTALGAAAVIPDMDPARPAMVDPEKFTQSIERYKVTYSFGSPAIWKVVSDYCCSKNIVLNSVRQILMAGAPVSGELIKRVQSILPEESDTHTPYGATECLPIASISGKEIIQSTWDSSRTGKGTCVGLPLPGISIQIIAVSDDVITGWDEKLLLPIGEIGEIVVSGGVVTRGYENNEKENLLAKIYDGDRLWHRIGDTGYLDDKGRLWFCGRRAHRVVSGMGTLFTIPCEAIINEHPDVFRSALVGCKGTGRDKQVKPVIIVELHKECSRNQEDILVEIQKLAKTSLLTMDIDKFLFHPSFPVDIRHNAKIFREKLAIWADEKLRGGM